MTAPIDPTPAEPTAPAAPTPTAAGQKPAPAPTGTGTEAGTDAPDETAKGTINNVR